MKLALSLVVDNSRPAESDGTQYIGRKSLFAPQSPPQDGSSHVKLCRFEGSYPHNRLEDMNKVIKANYM